MPEAPNALTLPATRPASASRFGFNLFAGVLGLLFLAWRQHGAPGQPWDNGLQAGILVAALIALHEHFVLRTHRNPSSGLDFDRAPQRSLARVLVKLFGLALTLGLIAGAYALFPEYHGSFYEPFWKVLKTYGLGLLALAPLYFWWLDGYLREPQDGYWQLGRLPGRWLRGDAPDAAARRLIGHHLAGWAVKAFFVPLMVVYIGQEVRGVHVAWQGLSRGGYAVFEFLFHLTFVIDLLFCVIGYTLTLRLFDAHIRWAEPTAFGWLVALACYQPFFSVLESQYLHYEDGISWGGWLAQMPEAKAAWAVVLVALLAIYALSTVAFGLRFSNLTARGIITDGPYRFSKHPAYLSKNLSWWMMSVPFVATAPAIALTNCLQLLLINALYYARARTEEAHLSRDPDYVRYALWMNEHGALAWLGRRWSWLRYRPPAQAGRTHRAQ